MTGRFDVVIPTLGRPSLRPLLRSLADAAGPCPGRVILVDDRPHPVVPLSLDLPSALAGRTWVIRGAAAGPAAARNRGWRLSDAGWIAFLDDDVVVSRTWLADLAADLADVPLDVAGSQGRITVPLDGRSSGPGGRPTDWERNVAGLQRARWATADLAYRRVALEAAGGFDERFTRAYREDADLGLRLVEGGWRLVLGDRRVIHPVRPADRWVSVRVQAGNADDVGMAALHGRDWRRRAGAAAGRRPRHVAITGMAGVAAVGLLAGRPRLALAGLAGWVIGTAELAWARISPGPRTREEIATMALTSAVLPAAATGHWLMGLARLPWWLRRRPARAPLLARPPAAVLLDRDGTLVEDVAYNGDPARVRPVAGAGSALDRLRAAGIRLAVITNQSGIARGLIDERQLDAVNARVDELLGPFDVWCVCPHGPDGGCACRKPEPGLVLEAARVLGVDPRDCVVVGDIGADLAAARAAGATGVLVPTAVTRPEEIAQAALTAPGLGAVAELLLGATGDDQDGAVADDSEGAVAGHRLMSEIGGGGEAA